MSNSHLDEFSLHVLSIAPYEGPKVGLYIRTAPQKSGLTVGGPMIRRHLELADGWNLWKGGQCTQVPPMCRRSNLSISGDGCQ